MKINLRVIDNMTPDLRWRMQLLQNKRPLLGRIGEEAAGAIRDHYKALPARSDGIPSGNFWQREGSDKIGVPEIGQESVTVRVSSVPMAHKYKGGRVEAKFKKALCFPIFDNLTSTIHLIMVKAVTHKPDPRARMEESEMSQRLLVVIRDYFDRLFKRGK